MHPSIITIGPFAIRSYGLMLAAGFLCGIMLAAYRAKKAGENIDHIYNLAVWIVFSSLIGARLYYVITHYHEFRENENLFFVKRFLLELKNMFWPVGANGQIGISGLVLYGGLIMATLVTWMYLHHYRLNIPKYLDIIAPSLGLGEFFTRIGCFLNGCCFGKPTESLFGVVFPENSAAGMYFSGLHIHPAQLYNSFAGLIIFIALIYMERHKRFNGFIALLYFILYSAGRFIIDYFRFYESSMKFYGFSHNQILSIVVFIIATSMLVYFMRTLPSKKDSIKKEKET